MKKVESKIVVIDYPITILGESKDGCTIIGGLYMKGKKEDDVTVKRLTISQSKGQGVNGDKGGLASYPIQQSNHNQ